MDGFKCHSIFVTSVPHLEKTSDAHMKENTGVGGSNRIEIVSCLFLL